MCNKVRFEHFWDAAYRLLEIQQNSSREDIPKSYYKCLDCGYWHLTKISVEERNLRNINVAQKVLKHQDKFIQQESEYWNNIFKNR